MCAMQQTYWNKEQKVLEYVESEGKKEDREIINMR